MGRKHSTKVGACHFAQTSFTLGVVILLYLILSLLFIVNNLLNLDLRLEFLLGVFRFGLYLTFILAPLAIVTGILSRYADRSDTPRTRRAPSKRTCCTAALGITSGLVYYAYLIVTLHMSGFLE